MSIKHTFSYKKLLRHKVVLSMLEAGEEFEHEILDNDSDFLRVLLDKLVEEVGELSQAKPEKLLGELADLEEIIQTIMRLKGWSRKKLQAEMSRKTEERGDFEGRDFVGTVTLTEENPWYAYLVAHPDQYPEIIPGEASTET